MKVKVFFDPIFGRLTGTEATDLVLEAPDLAGLVAALTDRYGQSFKEALIDPRGVMVPGVVVLADGVSLNPDSPIPEGVEIAFLTAIAGG
ncbi:MAG: MoaD/ThiS family protein [Dehalococcoidia bacterium]|nr:MoaD/ThiS family protein [Dehalococcoidia bacterium]